MNSRGNWTPQVGNELMQEDELLCSLTGELNAKQWSEIEKKFNVEFPNRERTCKQLRERFKNFLQYERGSALVKEWSEGQQKLLFQQYLQKGSKWTYISKLLPGKSEAYIKNKFYGGLRKSLRRINQIRKNQLPKFSKPIKYSSLIRVLQIKDKVFSLPQELREEAMVLREKIVRFSQMNLNKDCAEEVMNFCEELFKFNFESRCYRAKKVTPGKPRKHSINSGEQSDVSQQMEEEKNNMREPEPCQQPTEEEGNLVVEFTRSVQSFYEVPDKQEKLPLAFPRKVSSCIFTDSRGDSTDEKESERPAVQESAFRFGAFCAFKPIASSTSCVSLLEQLTQLRADLQEPRNCIQEAINLPMNKG